MPHLLFLHPPFTGDMGTHYTQLSMNPVEVFLETEREGRREGVSGWTQTRDAAATGQRLKGATCKMVYWECHFNVVKYQHFQLGAKTWHETWQSTIFSRIVIALLSLVGLANEPCCFCQFCPYVSHRFTVTHSCDLTGMIFDCVGATKPKCQHWRPGMRHSAIVLQNRLSHLLAEPNLRDPELPHLVVSYLITRRIQQPTGLLIYCHRFPWFYLI